MTSQEDGWDDNGLENEDGWGDDDDILDEGWDDDNDLDAALEEEGAQAEPEALDPILGSSYHSPKQRAVADEWSFDDSAGSDGETVIGFGLQQQEDASEGSDREAFWSSQHLDEVKQPETIPEEEDEDDGWGDDDIDFEQVESPPAPISPLRMELQAYWEQLHHIKQSINAILQFEYNQPEKAYELLEYYNQRPELTQYTIEKELPRMDYTIVTEEGQVLEDKAEIAHYFATTRSLATRCANQSLLADILQVCTGPDLLIRPQYHATAMAQSCRFRVDCASGMVQADAQLQLRLPVSWTLADCHVHVVFGTMETPMIEFRVVDVQPNEQISEEDWNSAVQLLESLQEGLTPMPEAQPQNFRDLFLHNTLAIHNEIASTLPQMPGFLPSDVIQAAEEELPMSPQARPTSILGGFMRSGLSRLAQTVKLPEEPPSLYTDVKTNQRPPSIWRPESEAQPFPRPPADSSTQFPRPPQDAQQEPSKQFPRPPPSIEEDTKFPRLPNDTSKEPKPTQKKLFGIFTTSSHEEPTEALEDGWDDDDDDYEDVPTGNDDDWVYNPEDDIIPTRKRWVNPRPPIVLKTSLFA